VSVDLCGGMGAGGWVYVGGGCMCSTSEGIVCECMQPNAWPCVAQCCAMCTSSVCAMQARYLHKVSSAHSDIMGASGSGCVLCAAGGQPRRAVNPNPEPVWSGAHTGLCVFLRRLLAPVWEARCVEPLASNPALLKAALSEQTLQVGAMACGAGFRGINACTAGRGLEGRLGV
jgi:hypothetical protein